MNNNLTKRALQVLALSLGLACGGSDDESTADNQSTSGAERATDGGRCETQGADLEVSEFDTSGDDFADVRKVFRRVGEGRLMRLVLICREADLNGDGSKDVTRFYNEEGRPLREEADRDFNGGIDEITHFEHGLVVRQELDSNSDGKVDHKIFYENGRPHRAERDVAGRSTAEQWSPDTWDYYEDGRVVRSGSDLDGDRRVDRWDRDAAWQRAREAAADAESSESSEEAPAESSDG